METILIIVFGVLFALFCALGILTNMHLLSRSKNKDKVYDDVVLRNGELCYAYSDDEVYDGVVVATCSGQYSFIRASTGVLYFLRTAKLPINENVVIAVRHRPSAMDKYLKPHEPPKYVVSEKGDIEAAVLCRLNKDILLCCTEEQNDDFIGSAMPKHMLVRCTVEEQAKYAKETDRIYDASEDFRCFEYEREKPCTIPIIRTDEKFIIPACLRKSNKRKRV